MGAAVVAAEFDPDWRGCAAATSALASKRTRLLQPHRYGAGRHVAVSVVRGGRGEGFDRGYRRGAAAAALSPTFAISPPSRNVSVSL